MAQESKEPSEASGCSVVCPYVTGTVTRYCTLTPFTLTDAERTAVLFAARRLEISYVEERTVAATLRGLLERAAKR